MFMEESEGLATPPPPADRSLSDLQSDDASLRSLLGVLLNIRTLPHLVLIMALSAVLHLLANVGSTTLSAMGFISLAGGYFFTGLLSGSSRVQGWTQLPETADFEESTSPVQRLFRSFRICIFPLVMSGVAFSLLLLLVGEQGALGDWSDALPIALSACFVVWSVVQGRGFARWLASVAAGRLPASQDRPAGGTLVSSVVVVSILSLVVVLLLTAFEWMAPDLEPAVPATASRNVLFFGAFAGLLVLGWRRTSSLRMQASTSKDLHAFSVRWMLLSQALITWHLLTMWRHWKLSPSAGLLLTEELLLMVFTVLMAIWGLTSKSFRSPLRLVSKTNALPMGLAFGYAYAGSVAMLTVVLDDIRNVMMAGHFVVLLTFLWVQPRVLGGVLQNHEDSATIKAIVEQSVIAPEETLAAPAPSPDEGPTSEETEDASIGKDVAWQKPEVLADGVEWGDEPIELLD